jgi:hypothetical protein
MRQDRHSSHSLYGGVVSLLERDYTSIGLSAICLDPRRFNCSETHDSKRGLHTSNPELIMVKSLFHVSRTCYSQRTGAPLRPGLGSASVGDSKASDSSISSVGDSVSEAILRMTRSSVRFNVDCKLDTMQDTVEGLELVLLTTNRRPHPTHAACVLKGSPTLHCWNLL